MQNVLLVTGGSRGIGAATAILAASRGYAVAVNYLQDGAAAASVVAQIENAGGKAIALQADVSRESEVVRMFSELDAQLGPINALVNNAGILERQSRFEAIDGARLQRIFAVNVFGAMFCAREAIKRMSTRIGGNGGAIVNVSSVAARLGAPGEYVDYAAAKGAIDSMTIGLAQEVAPRSIRVNAVRVGYIYTDIHASGGEPGRVDRVKGGLPLRRGGHPVEVARAILWLLSDEAAFSTGTFIDVSGGK